MIRRGEKGRARGDRQLSNGWENENLGNFLMKKLCACLLAVCVFCHYNLIKWNSFLLDMLPYYTRYKRRRWFVYSFLPSHSIHNVSCYFWIVCCAVFFHMKIEASKQGLAGSGRVRVNLQLLTWVDSSCLSLSLTFINGITRAYHSENT